MPSLHDELAGASASACKVCTYLTTLPAAEAEEWTTELARPVTVVGHTAVVNALARRRIAVTETSVRRHRSRHAA